MPSRALPGLTLHAARRCFCSRHPLGCRQSCTGMFCSLLHQTGTLREARRLGNIKASSDPVLGTAIAASPFAALTAHCSFGRVREAGLACNVVITMHLSFSLSYFL